MWNLKQSCVLMLRTTNLVPGSASAILPSQPRYVQVALLNIFVATRTNSQVLPARHLQLASRGPAIRELSDQVQECASEAADSNLTTTLNFFFRVTNFFHPFLSSVLFTAYDHSSATLQYEVVDECFVTVAGKQHECFVTVSGKQWLSRAQFYAGRRQYSECNAPEQ